MWRAFTRGDTTKSRYDLLRFMITVLVGHTREDVEFGSLMAMREATAAEGVGVVNTVSFSLEHSADAVIRATTLRSFPPRIYRELLLESLKVR